MSSNVTKSVETNYSIESFYSQYYQGTLIASKFCRRRVWLDGEGERVVIKKLKLKSPKCKNKNKTLACISIVRWFISSINGHGLEARNNVKKTLMDSPKISPKKK